MGDAVVGKVAVLDANGAVGGGDVAETALMGAGDRGGGIVGREAANGVAQVGDQPVSGLPLGTWTWRVG